MGTVNFGDDVFLNRWEFIVDLHTRMQERGIVPEYEIFDLGQLATLQRLLGKYGLPAGGHVHVDFVMGVPGGMPGHDRGAGRLHAGHARPARGHHVLGDRHRPHHAAGDARLAVGRRAPAGRHGGHGHLRQGQPVESNAQLVARAAAFARLAQRPPLSAADARALLGMGDSVHAS